VRANCQLLEIIENFYHFNQNLRSTVSVLESGRWLSNFRQLGPNLPQTAGSGRISSPWVRNVRSRIGDNNPKTWDFYH